jgi:hypothetical protein
MADDREFDSDGLAEPIDELDGQRAEEEPVREENAPEMVEEAPAEPIEEPEEPEPVAIEEPEEPEPEPIENESPAELRKVVEDERKARQDLTAEVAKLKRETAEALAAMKEHLGQELKAQTKTIQERTQAPRSSPFISSGPMSDDDSSDLDEEPESLYAQLTAEGATVMRSGGQVGLVIDPVEQQNEFITGAVYNPYEMLPTLANVCLTDAAQIDTWDRGTAGTADGPVDQLGTCGVLYRGPRVVYAADADAVLHLFTRDVTYDNMGALATISAETETNIDVPTACVVEV